MIRIAVPIAVLCLWPQEEEVRFRAIDVTIDSGSNGLAAYQFELVCDAARARIVGIEGGETNFWNEPPYYDSEALVGGRVIIAGFTLEDGASAGKVRVARIMVQETGTPTYAPRMMAAAAPGGERIDVRIELGGRK